MRTWGPALVRDVSTHPCSILTFTGGGVASGILSGSPGPLAGGPTSEMSGMLGDKKIINKIFMRFLFPNCSTHDGLCLCVGSARCGNIKTFCLSRIEKVMRFVTVTPWLRDSLTPWQLNYLGFLSTNIVSAGPHSEHSSWFSLFDFSVTIWQCNSVTVVTVW